MPANDIYGQNNSNQGTKLITSHEMLMTISGNNKTLAGILIQNISINYSQPVQIIREVGSKNFYSFAFPSTGVLTIGRLTAKDNKFIDIFPESIRFVPGPGRSNPNIELRSTDGSNIGYVLRQCITENFTGSTDANGMFFQQNVTIKFVSFDDLSK